MANSVVAGSAQLTLVLLFVAGTFLMAADEVRAQEKSDIEKVATSAEWFAGSGEDLRLRLQGTVLDGNGQAAVDCQVRMFLKANDTTDEVTVSVEGNAFEWTKSSELSLPW